MNRVAAVAVVTLVAVGGGLREADACTCLRRGAPCEEFWKAAAVFVGRVDSIARAQKPGGFPASRAVSFTVLDALMGVDETQVVVRTGSGGGDCGYRFREGQDYFVYATRNEETGELSTGICSRTRPVEDAASDLEYARAIRAGAPLLGRISGSVMRRHESFDRAPSRDPEPMPDVSIRFEREGVAVARATTDGYGGFSTTGLTPGRYRVIPELADTYYASVLPDQVTLADARGCADVLVSAAYNGRLSGRVVDAAGQQIAGLTIELTTPAGAARPTRSPLRAVTGTDGRYEFDRIPPGAFVVGINTHADLPGARRRFPRIFHPGVETLAGATRVTIEPGAPAALPDLIVPRSIRFVPITGVVFHPDGTPASGARVYLKGPDERDSILSEPVTTDGSGRFVLAALEGRPYRVFAERHRAGGVQDRVDSSDQVPVTAADGLTPLRLALRRRY